MAGNTIITVDYEKSFTQMMIDVNVPQYQQKIIFKQLETKELEFGLKGKINFSVQDFRFNESTRSKAAERYIRGHDIETKWKPFDIEHLLAYFRVDSSKFKSRLVFATRRTFAVGGEPYIFCMGIDKGYPDLELVPDNHAWTPNISIFPGQRKIAI